MTDFPTLAAAIASQLDGVIRPSGNASDDAPAGNDCAWIDLQHEREGLRVVLRRGMGSEYSRVRAVMSQTAASRGEADYRETPDFYKLETAAAMSRGADVIARQIESKIVQPALPMLEAWNVKRAELAADAAQLCTAVMRYRKAFPGAQVGKRQERDTEAHFHLSGRAPDTGYIAGRIRSDGRLYVDRTGSVREAVAHILITSATEPVGSQVLARQALMFAAATLTVAGQRDAARKVRKMAETIS